MLSRFNRAAMVAHDPFHIRLGRPVILSRMASSAVWPKQIVYQRLEEKLAVSK